MGRPRDIGRHMGNEKNTEIGRWAKKRDEESQTEKDMGRDRDNRIPGPDGITMGQG